MNILIAALLGLVQGLCEFLPVSSSGHLVLFQNIFGINEGAMFFDTMLHLGTLAAVIAVYYRQLWALIKKPFQKKVYLLLLSTLVTTVIAFVFKDLFDSAFEGKFLGVGFLITAVILFLNEKLSHGKKDIEHMKYTESLGVGLMQGVAIFPGVSRSGSTIAGARFFGLSKEAAAEYSFIAAVPIMVAATGYDMLKSWHLFSAADIPFFAVGMIGSFLSALLAVKVFIALMGRVTLVPFAVYRLLIAPFIYYFMVN